ncbi:MAG: hypothetical protein M0Z84_13760 [Gammaproteobacteria bacterium]|nr:hypothetical protein [Gammaproteobacteria bacterium]
MAEDAQYLRIDIAGAPFLLASRTDLIIEQRENLAVDEGSGAVRAWRLSGLDRWPAIGLDHSLRPLAGDSWRQAVFFGFGPHPVGLVVDDVQILTQSVGVERFTPLGPAPTDSGHLFSGIWIRDGQIVLRFEADALAAFLRELEARQ